MDSKGKIEKLLIQIDKLCWLGGVNMLQKDYKPNIRTFICVGIASMTNIFFFYTQYCKFSSGQFLAGVEVFAYCGVDWQGLAKFYESLMKKDHLYGMAQRLIAMHSNGQIHEGHKRILENCVDRCTLAFKLFIFMYGGAGIIFLSYPVLVFLLTKEKVLFLELWIPLVSIDSTTGYAGTMAFQLLILFYAVLSLLAVDMFFMIVSVHYTALVDIFKISITELSTQLKYSNDRSHKRKIRIELRNLLIEHKNSMNYLSIHDEMYSRICFVQLTSCSLMAIITLFVGTVKFWVPGYGLFLVSIFQLMTYCLIGTIVEVWSERATLAIYDMPWYYFDKERSMEFLFMYKKAQNPSKITVGGFAELSVCTGQEILNKIYSIYMMMLTFIEGKTFE